MVGIAVTACGTGEGTNKAGNEDTSVASGIVQLAPEDRVAAPEISGPSLEGDTVDIADWRDKVAVVNVWGSWCPPCRAETPDLNKTARETAPDVEFLGIAVRESAATSLAYTRKEEVPYPSISDSDGSLLRQFAEPLPAVAVPTTYVLDREGRIAVRVLDQVTYSTLTALIEEVQAEDPGAP